MAAAGLIVAVALGAWLLFGMSSPVPATAAPEPRGPAGIGGFAELFVAEYLTADADAVGEFLPAAPPLSAMAPDIHYAARTAAIEVDSIGPDYWSVVVAADVLEFEDGGYVPAGLQHFQVGVIDDGGRLVAAGLPSRVASPPPRRSPPRSLAAANGTPSDTVAALTGDFLEALLVGGRNISHYIVPSSEIAAVVPPYTQLSVTSLSTYPDGTVRAIVDATNSANAAVTLEYFLHIDQTSGDPLVGALLPGPPTIHHGGATP